jgi:hypothetical protein
MTGRRTRASAPARRLTLIAALLLAMIAPASARADGDPGSDVLVYSNYYAGAAGGLSLGEQAGLGRLLDRAAASGFPVRVAIVGGPADLGFVTAAWRRPQPYAAFLGTELALAYAQRLVVVMPNGLGFYWHAHPAAVAVGARALAGVQVAPGPAGLAAAAMQSVRTLAAAAGVRLTGRGQPVRRPPAARRGRARRLGRGRPAGARERRRRERSAEHGRRCRDRCARRRAARRGGGRRPCVGAPPPQARGAGGRVGA